MSLLRSCVAKMQIKDFVDAVSSHRRQWSGFLPGWSRISQYDMWTKDYKHYVKSRVCIIIDSTVRIIYFSKIMMLWFKTGAVWSKQHMLPLPGKGCPHCPSTAQKAVCFCRCEKSIRNQTFRGSVAGEFLGLKCFWLYFQPPPDLWQLTCLLFSALRFLFYLLTIFVLYLRQCGDNEIKDSCELSGAPQKVNICYEHSRWILRGWP